MDLKKPRPRPKTRAELLPGLELLVDGSLWERISDGKMFQQVGKLAFTRCDPSGSQAWFYQRGSNRMVRLYAGAVLKRCRHAGQDPSPLTIRYIPKRHIKPL